MLKLVVVILCFLYLCGAKNDSKSIQRRALQPTHEKSQPDKWMDKFYGKKYQPQTRISLVNLIFTIAKKYLIKCIPVILYDQEIYQTNPILFQQLFRGFPSTFQHGQIKNSSILTEPRMLNKFTKYCQSFVLFIPDVMDSKRILKTQHSAYVLLISWSSQWRIHEFLSSTGSHSFVNLLIVGESKSANKKEDTFLLYTHNLFIDGLGSSSPKVLTSWQRNKLVQPDVDLYPAKVDKGVAGHRFIVGLAHQPPFVVKQILRNSDGSNARIHWDGLEVRLIQLISKILNFTIEYKEVTNLTLGPGDSVLNFLKLGRADVGLAGIYATADRLNQMDTTHGHSSDCATFITLSSTALPKYRAIMGPFQWTVWAALTFTYLFGIIPLTFSDTHSLRHLYDHPGDIENMFWYVFGTFTNCFTFLGERSWSRSKKLTTRLLVGWYWAFTIIITACYTGSIIAFVTLPVFPETIDSTNQLIEEGYRIVTLNRGGWETWYQNSSDKRVKRLLNKIAFVPDVATGLHNVTNAFFWKYAFLGSRNLLDFVIKTNFSRLTGRRNVFHIADECFVPYTVSMLLPRDSIYKSAMNKVITYSVQAGLIPKLLRDLKWDLYRTQKGRLLQISTGTNLKLPPPEERALTLDDTQGMFLLLAFGFILGATSLFSEYVGGCVNWFKTKNFLKRGKKSGPTTLDPSYRSPTPIPPALKRPIPRFSITEPLTSEDGSIDDEFESDIGDPIIVHQADMRSHITEETSTINSKDIDRMFDLDHLFGEEQHFDEENDDVDSNENDNRVVIVTNNNIDDVTDRNDNIADAVPATNNNIEDLSAIINDDVVAATDNNIIQVVAINNNIVDDVDTNINVDDMITVKKNNPV